MSFHPWSTYFYISCLIYTSLNFWHVTVTQNHEICHFKNSYITTHSTGFPSHVGVQALDIAHFETIYVISSTCSFQISLLFWYFDVRDLLTDLHSHPRTLFEMPMAHSWNSGSFPSNSHVSATFSFWIHSGKFWNLGISNKLWDIQCWRKGRILINLYGKINVRNWDLSQRDFFARSRTVLGVAKSFFGNV